MEIRSSDSTSVIVMVPPRSPSEDLWRGELDIERNKHGPGFPMFHVQVPRLEVGGIRVRFYCADELFDSFRGAQRGGLDDGKRQGRCHGLRRPVQR